MIGLPVVTTDTLPDGRMVHLGRGPLLGQDEMVLLGAGPIDTSEWCRREALRIVRTRLADVLEWLGEKPWSPPATSAQILHALRREAA